MTDADLARWLKACPVLQHMAEAGSWPSIERHGLLSTSALLDLYGVGGEPRDAMERRRRPASVRLEREGLEGAWVRDQIPMSDAGLLGCLTDGMTPAEWYATLNARVFLWPDPSRLDRLLAAPAYRNRAHDVLELDAASLVGAWRDTIELSPINTGFTGRYAVPRGPATFQTVPAYVPPPSRRSPRDWVAEVTVPGGIPDAARHVLRVVRRSRHGVEGITWERADLEPLSHTGEGFSAPLPSGATTR